MTKVWNDSADEAISTALEGDSESDGMEGKWTFVAAWTD
jgi:hypothetical protein